MPSLTTAETGPVTYRFLASDLVTGLIKEELPLSNVSYSQVLNSPGSFSAEIGLDSSKATREVLDPNKTAIHVERNGVLLWGGILSTVALSMQDRKLQLGAQGFWSYFKRRFVLENRRYGGWDQMDIVKELILYAQGQGEIDPTITPGNPSGYGGLIKGNIGVTLDSGLRTESSGIVPSNLAENEADDESNFDGTQFINIGDRIEQMSKEDSLDVNQVRGFDFGIFPRYNFSGSQIEKIFKISYPRMGIDTGLVLQIGSLMTDLQYTIDGAKQANFVLAAGKGEGQYTSNQASDYTSLPVDEQIQQNSFPQLEALVHFKDVMNLDTLKALADSALAVLAEPTLTIKATVRYSDDFSLLLSQVGNARDTFLGDSIRLKVKEGWLDVDDTFRISEWAATVGDDGSETLDLTLTHPMSVQFS